MVTIATRASWGARHKNGDLTLSGQAREVFLHHTVTAQLPASATVAQEQAQMRTIEAIGQARFRTGISYNVVVFPSGRAYQGVSWNRRGTHTGGRNSTSRSIAFAGNTDVHQPTAAQIATARAIYHHGRGRWWTSAAPLRTHRDVAATACAGRHAIAQLPAMRTPPPPPPPPPETGDDDMRYFSFTNGAEQPLPTDAWTLLRLNAAGDTSLFAGPGRFSALAELAISAELPAGAEVQVRFIVIDFRQGEPVRLVSTYLAQEIVGTAGQTFGKVPQLGHIGSPAAGWSRRLRVQANTFHPGVRVTNLHAKAMLFT